MDLVLFCYKIMFVNEVCFYVKIDTPKDDNRKTRKRP